jgi:hypothetical protein
MEQVQGLSNRDASIEIPIRTQASRKVDIGFFGGEITIGLRTVAYRWAKTDPVHPAPITTISSGIYIMVSQIQAGGPVAKDCMRYLPQHFQS